MTRRVIFWACLVTAAFIQPWFELATAAGRLYYLRESPLTSTLLPLLLAEGLVAAGASAVGLAISRLCSLKISHDCFEASAFALVWFVTTRDLGVIGLTAGIVFVCIAFWQVRKAAAIAENVVLTAAPVLLLLVARGAWAGLTPPHEFADGKPKPLVKSAATSSRVVLVIFDGMGRDTAFEARPPDVHMPNFDHLMTESFYGARAYSPAYWTLYSIPAMTMGRPVYAVRTGGPDLLNVQIAPGGKFVPWSSQQTVFDDVAGMQMNSAVSGWYNPYGRLLEGKVNSIYWASADVAVESATTFVSGPLWDRVLAQLRAQAAEIPLVGKPLRIDEQQWVRRQRIEALNGVCEHGKAFILDPSYHFIVIHLPVPHAPGVYDRHKNELSTSSQADYYDNLALADRLLGDIQRTIVQSGTRTHLLIASDHGVRWRYPSKIFEHVPHIGAPPDSLKPESAVFFIRFGGWKRSLRYTKPFNTIAVRSLITLMLKGELHAPEDVAAFLDRFDSPPTVTNLEY